MNDITIALSEREFVILWEALQGASMNRLLQIKLSNGTYYSTRWEINALSTKLKTTINKLTEGYTD